MHSSVGLTSSEKAQAVSAPDLALVAPVERQTPAAGFRSHLTKLEALADFLTVIAAVMSSYALYHLLGLGKQLHYPRAVVLGVSATFAAVIVLMLDRVGAYSRGTSLLRVRETEHVLRVSVQALGFILGISFFTSFLFSRWLLVIALGLVPLFLFLQKHFAYVVVQYLHSKGFGIERVLIYGSGSTGRRVYSVLRRSSKLGLEPVAFLDDNIAKVGSTIFELGYENRRSAPVMHGPVTRQLVHQCRCRHGRDSDSLAAIRKVSNGDRGNSRSKCAGLFRTQPPPSLRPWLDFQDIDGVLLASFSRHPNRFAYEWAKRILDFTGAAVLLVVGFPLFLLLGLLIKLDSKGPGLFQQERVGLNGKRFRMFKFRTMYTEAPTYAHSPKEPDDRRITRLGRLLRRTSLDELPQLLNVLLGNMSLVGPRPEMPFIVDTYTDRDSSVYR